MNFLERLINKFLTFVFGTMPDGDRKVWVHAQNLNEDDNGKPKGCPYYGRAWLHFGINKCIRVEWHLLRWSLGTSFSLDPSEHEVKFHIAFPPVSLWLSFQGMGPKNLWHKIFTNEFMCRWNESTGGYKGSSRYTEFNVFNVYVFEWCLHWDFLKFDWGWSRKMPRWMDGSFNLPNFLFGPTKMTEKLLSTHEVMIPMPEGNYPATIKLEDCVWRRPRWPFHIHHDIYANVDMKIGIPHAGKGENSWDCGDDAVMGLSRKADTVEKAIAAVVEVAFRNRKRYNGKLDPKYPDPAEKSKESTT